MVRACVNATALALNDPHHMIGPGAIADGDSVIFELRMRATLANGRPYDNEYCFIFELVGERVRRIREYIDTKEGHAQIFGDS